MICLNSEIIRKPGRPKGHKLSKETKDKIRKAKLGEKHPLYGKHLSLEYKEKISSSTIGRKFSEETREKISKAKKNPFRNIELFDELLCEYADDPESVSFLISNIGNILSWDDVKPETELLSCSIRETSVPIESVSVCRNINEED